MDERRYEKVHDCPDPCSKPVNLRNLISRLSPEKYFERIHSRRDTNYSYCLVIMAHLRNVCFEDPAMFAIMPRN